MHPLACYREVWLVDFEFTASTGHRPHPLCLAARELRSGRLRRVWLEPGVATSPPYPTGPDTLFVAYYASAELGCHLALGWEMPTRVLDLFAEFRVLTNGRRAPCGASLLGALAWFGLDPTTGTEKEEMRALAGRGGPYTPTERAALLNYCQADVDALARLLPAMLPSLDLGRALLRGRYMAAAARMEWTGIPIDVPVLANLRENWGRVRAGLVTAIDPTGAVFAPARPSGNASFSADRWAAYLRREGIPWPRLPSGRLALDDDTFREMARLYPDQVGPFREIRYTLSQLRSIDLAVGPDGRNRCLLSCFRARTGRNQPSTSRFAFGPACWLRSLIRPGPGRALAYVDWSGQEYGIAAALSGDRAMQADYRNGDPYLAFGRRIGAVPATATKLTHPRERDRLKLCCGLGAMYGAGAETVARQMGVDTAVAAEWLRAHRRAYAAYWRWSDTLLEAAMLAGRVITCYGWAMWVSPSATSNSLRNYPMQAHGAEMMRLAACLATERGVEVCCPVHDAFLIEADSARIDDAVEGMREAMRDASELVLPGFPLRTDAKVVYYPDRYVDPRGERMWDAVARLLGGSDTVTPREAATTPLRPCDPRPVLFLLNSSSGF